MSGVLIVSPLTIAALSGAGTGLTNLLTASPKEAWVANQFSLSVDIDMGAAVSVDSFFLGHTNATSSATWIIYSATGLGTGLTQIKASAAMRAADSIGPGHHAFHRLATPVTSRYFRLTLTQTGASFLYAGILIVGQAFEKYRELGGGRLPVDTGPRQSLSDGGFGVGAGAFKAQFNFSFIDLTDTDVKQLWAIVGQVGLRKPVLVVEDAALAIGQNEAIHYGVFERFEPYARSDPAATRWAFSHEEWR